MKSLVTDKIGGKQCLSLDKALDGVQTKIGNIFSPLSQIWEFIEGQRNDVKTQIESQEDQEDIPKELLEMFETSTMVK